MTHYVLKLYVTGKTHRSEQAIRNLRAICNDQLGGEFEMEVIDVLERLSLRRTRRSSPRRR